jgi:hypothetical protein
LFEKPLVAFIQADGICRLHTYLYIQDAGGRGKRNFVILRAPSAVPQEDWRPSAGTFPGSRRHRLWAPAAFARGPAVAR